MDFIFHTLSVLTAGLALAFGFINVLAGYHQGGRRVYFYFGILALGVAGYFLGFHLVGEEVSNTDIWGKIIMFFAVVFFSMLPWFISAYSGFHRPYLIYGINGIAALTYVLLWFTPQVSGEFPLWLVVSHFVLAGVGLYGFLASIHVIRRQGVKAHWYFLASMAIYLVLMVNELVNYYFRTQFLFPESLGGMATLDYFPILLMFLMGSQLATDAYKRVLLEKSLTIKDKQWRTLLEKVQLLVISLDNKGNLTYVNPFFTRFTGYPALDVVGKNWFDQFYAPEDAAGGKLNFIEMVRGRSGPEQRVRPLRLRSGETRNIRWSIVPLRQDTEEISGFISIGFDVSAREGALAEVQLLKSQLEKENLELKEELRQKKGQVSIIGESSAIHYALNKAYQVAPTNASVMLEGETGVGKELFAELIHENSKRKSKPLIKVNCAALPKDLIESELFGHEKGAFTGAAQQRKGRFEMADGGTLFLDEISELPLELQPKLLRVLQRGEFERLGSEKTIKVDVRILSATNRNLQEEIQLGNFREDLYYRLNVYPVTIPPLRQRTEDIPLLVRFFVDRLSKKVGKTITDISKKDLRALTRCEWRGNVRELENYIERAIISSPGPTLRLEPLSGNPVSGPTPGLIPPPALPLEEVEKQYIESVLNTCDWKINGDKGAAEVLQLHPSTLRSKMKKLGIQRRETTA